MSKKDLKYSFYLGCVIPNRYPFIEASIRNVFKELNIELIDMQGASCCPAPGVFRGFDISMWLAVGARNITIAEENGADIVLGCNGCYATLLEVNHQLKHDKKKRDMVNEHLAKIGREYKGSIEVKHLIEVLYYDFGIDNLKDYIKHKFNNLRVGVHYGCHILKDSSTRPWGGESEEPRFFDELVEITGAKSIDYKDKLMCCGAGGAVRTASLEVSLDFTREKLENMRNVNVDCSVNCCPFCHLQMDLGQNQVNDKFKDIIGEPYKIPIIYYTQLLGLAMGMNPGELGLVATHDLKGVPPFISIQPFMEKVKEQLL
jgi:heterodisulfide reductase subunit B